MKKTFICGFITLLIGVTITNISLSINSDKFNIENLFSTIEALASGEDLPPVDVICSNSGWGRCWEIDKYGQLPTSFTCKFTGNMSNLCPQPFN